MPETFRVIRQSENVYKSMTADELAAVLVKALLAADTIIIKKEEIAIGVQVSKQQNPKHDRRLLFASEADRLYRLSRGTVARMVKERRLRSIRRGKRTLVSAKECEQMLGVYP